MAAPPEVVFASMWHAQRKLWTIISGAKERSRSW